MHRSVHACVNKEKPVRGETRRRMNGRGEERKVIVWLRERPRRNLPDAGQTCIAGGLSGVCGTAELCPVRETPSAPLQLSIYPARSLHCTLLEREGLCGKTGSDISPKLQGYNPAERGGGPRRL